MPFLCLVKGLGFKNLRITTLSVCPSELFHFLYFDLLLYSLYSGSVLLKGRDCVLFISLCIPFLLFPLDPNIMPGTY